MSTQASEIAATVGQAFQLAYEKFQDAKAAQLGFRDMKEKVRPTLQSTANESLFHHVSWCQTLISWSSRSK